MLLRFAIIENGACGSQWPMFRIRGRKIVSEWFDEDVVETSHNEDKMLHPDFVLLSEHESSDEQSVDKNMETIGKNTFKMKGKFQPKKKMNKLVVRYFYGKNRMKWSKRAPNNKVRSRSENIIIHLPGLKGPK